MTQVITGWAVEGSSSAGTTLRKMRRIVQDAARSQEVILTARSISRYGSPRDYRAHAKSIRDWVAAHVRFSRDPLGVELLTTPQFMLSEIQKRGYVSGDCDDAATLSAALARAIGFPTVIEAVAFFSKRAPYQHVYTLVQVGRKPDGTPEFVDMDTTRPARNLPPAVSRRISVKV